MLGRLSLPVLRPKRHGIPRLEATGYTGFGGFTTRLIGSTEFSPGLVPEVAAGYYWDPEARSNLGAVNYRQLEVNGNAAFDFVQVTVANQPEVISTNGFEQLRYRPSTDPNPSFVATTGNVQAGWTGASYWAAWIRFPGGAITGTDTFFNHSAAGQRRVIERFAAGLQSNRGFTSSDGAVQAEYRWNLPVDANWHYYERVFDPTQAANARHLAYSDRVVIAPSVTVAIAATIFDANTTIQLGQASGVANADTTDMGLFYYANGIPSDAFRDLLYRYKAPVIIP